MNSTPDTHEPISHDILDLDITDPVEDPASAERLRKMIEAAQQSLYFKVATFWHRRGFRIVPGTVDKAPVTGFKALADGAPQTEDDLLQHALNNPDAVPLLLTGCGKHRLAFVDVDDPTYLAWAEATYGKTPWKISTGRAGGGFHLGYRVPVGVEVRQQNKIVGPPESVLTWGFDVVDGRPVKHKGWGQTPIDVKSHHNYVVAPGARHKSGLYYLPQDGLRLRDITSDWIEANVPMFPVDVHERLKAESTERKRAKNIEVLGACPATKQRVTSDGNLSFTEVDEEPFLQWCAENPQEVDLSLWWGLAANLAAIHGAAGRSEFHRLSAMDPEAYYPAECDQTWGKVLHSMGGKPVSYRSLVGNGYWGPVPPPERGTSPARFIAQRGIPASGEFGFDGPTTAAPVAQAATTNAPPAWTPAPRPDAPQATPDGVERELGRMLDGKAPPICTRSDLRDGLQGDELGEVEQEERDAARVAAELESDATIMMAHANSVFGPKQVEKLTAPPAYVASLRQPKPPMKLPEDLTSAAEKAVREAYRAAQPLRDLWVADGLTEKGKSCKALRQVLSHAKTGNLMAYARRCDRLACRDCGPLNAMMKAMATVHLPILDEGDRVVGSCLGRRPVYFHLIDSSDVARWTRRFRRWVSRGDRLPPEKNQMTPIGGSRSLGQDAYVMFSPEGSSEVIVLSTIDLGGERLTAVDLASAVMILTAWTYQPVVHRHAADLEGMHIDGLDGTPMDDPASYEVTGRISSSQGLRLDPDQILRLSRGTTYTVASDEVRDFREIGEVASQLSLRTRADMMPTVDGESLEPERVMIEAPVSERHRDVLLDALRPGADLGAVLARHNRPAAVAALFKEATVNDEALADAEALLG